jgi:ADP-heptose:LPS heptosyltransferase
VSQIRPSRRYFECRELRASLRPARPVQTAAAAVPGRALQPIVIQFGRLGDMVMLTSLLSSLRQRFGNPCLVIGAGPWSSSLYVGHPDVARVWTFARSLPNAPGPTWWRVWSVLRRSDPSPIYVCEHRPRQLRRIRRLLAFARIDPARCLFITRELADAGGHWVDRLGRFGGRIPPGLRAADCPLAGTARAPAPRLRVLVAERMELHAWLNARGWAERARILIQPGNFRTLSRRREQWRLHDDKAWPTRNWAALLHKLHAARPDARIILCGAPAESPMLRQIELQAALPQVAIAELPLRRLLALCESAHSMISVDTGPAHVAAALGLPLVVMYGAESPSRWLPRSPSDSPVLAVGGPPRSARVDALAVDEVFDAWCALTAR